MGPVAVALYVLADKEPRPGEQERFIAPMWKQAPGSTLHCVAGDATGVIIAATITGLLGLPMWFDMTAEYVPGFIFGFFIFQALFMKDMFGGPFTIVEIDSFPAPEAARRLRDTVNVAPGQRYDFIWEAREPGKWLLRCHINHHTTNNNVEQEGGGGLMLIIDVAD